MAAMWTLLSMLLCISTVSGAEDVCATCAPSPPAQSAALLQSSVQRHAKTAGGPHVFSPAQLFGPGPRGRHVSHMGRMGPRMGPRMTQPRYDFALRHAREKQRRAQSSQESLYESSYAGAEITPCQEPTSWTPDKDIYGWCDTYTMPVQPDEANCAGAEELGCRFSWGYCYCEKEEGCAAVGGTWNPWTCQNEMDNMLPEYMDKIKEAALDGTCEGKDVWGWKVEDMVAYPASQCCTDFPNTMCEHNVEPMTPCKDQADFHPESYAYAWCDLYSSSPSKEQCEATPGCTEEWGWCNCRTKSSCELLGGYFMGTTCEEELGYWYPGVHKAVKEALEKQTCQGVEGPWGDIKYSVDMMGFSCCGSQKSICEELDNYDSGYYQYY